MKVKKNHLFFLFLIPGLYTIFIESTKLFFSLKNFLNPAAFQDSAAFIYQLVRTSLPLIALLLTLFSLSMIRKGKNQYCLLVVIFACLTFISTTTLSSSLRTLGTRRTSDNCLIIKSQNFAWKTGRETPEEVTLKTQLESTCETRVENAVLLIKEKENTQQLVASFSARLNLEPGQLSEEQNYTFSYPVRSKSPQLILEVQGN